MNTPKELQYSKTHEWLKKTESGNYLIGLTDHAQSELGDLVFVNLPEVGDTLSIGESFSDVESVKAVSDVYSPVAGKVVAVNDELADAPEAINADCYAAWMIEAGGVSETEELLSAEEYEAFVAEEG